MKGETKRVEEAKVKTLLARLARTLRKERKENKNEI